MPELPEVEIIKRELASHIVNLKITNIYQSFLTFRSKEQPDLCELRGQVILNVYRRNKYLILETENYYLVLHLGMTGQVIYALECGDKKFIDIIKERHIHMALNLSKGFLYFHDVRRFGGFNLLKKEDFTHYLKLPLFSLLGIEPLEKEFTYKNFTSKIFSSTENVKGFLMNGSNICGIGNIYANEILFSSGVNPEEKINVITDKQKKSLFKNITLTLNKAIELGGSSISDFIHTNGTSGSMQNFYNVYGRSSLPCKQCNTPINKIKQNGRSTFYCPKCQKRNSI